MEITLSDLRQHILVESSIRIHENRKDDNSNVGTINMVAEGKPSRSGDKRKRNDSSKGKTIVPNTEKVRWKCGKPGHRRKNCFVLKNKQKKAKGNGHVSTSKGPSIQGNLAILNENSNISFSSMKTNISAMQDDTLS